MFPGWAKRMAELQIDAYRQQYGLDWSIVRPCNVYGLAIILIQIMQWLFPH